MARNSELMEWLGLTPADLLIYCAIAAVAAMFFVHDVVVDIVLAIVGVGLALAACPIGMAREPDVSNFTNAIKRGTYRVGVTLVSGRMYQAARDRLQKSVHCLCSLRYNARTWHTACAPSSLHRMPAPLRRCPTTVLHALSTAPEPMYQPLASYVG